MALPAPTALGATSRYIPAGVRRFTWVPTIAVKATPTSAELAAGTDLTGEIAGDGITGFATTSATVDAPDYGTRFTPKIPGLITSDDSSIKTYLSSNSTDARSLLTRDLAGFVVIYPEGIVTGGKCSVFPSKVTTFMIDEVPAGDPATGTAQFAITSTPVENIAIPTA
jgi:hypothetical protein